MACKTYRIYVSSTASGSNLASLRIQGSGSIKAVSIAAAAIGGAGTGWGMFEVSKQNAKQATNDAQNTIAHAFIEYANAGSSKTNHMVIHDCPVKDGDYIYLHADLSGTAPASQWISVDIIVEQPNA